MSERKTVFPGLLVGARLNMGNAMRRATSGLVALLFILCAGMSAHAKGNNWKTLYDKSVSLYEQGSYKRAEVVAEKALRVAERSYGPDHPNVATCLNHLADLHYAQDRYAQAESFYTRALSIREKALGPEHPDVAASLNHLAMLYDSQGRHAQAEPFCRRSLAIWEKALGPDHPADVVACLENMAAIYRKGGLPKEAKAVEKRIAAIRAAKQ